MPGQDRPRRRARHRATNAARLVSPGPLQVDGGTGDAGAADGAQTVQSKLYDIEMSLRARWWER